ncbi:hypothetical protein GCM10010977_15690 [Citricoccus zhacaiensis]|uniref:Uncharacterized protein n=1 Tax=Citricoccus zhacaiensis TaxID=489142 RepID=A0ABQ2LYG5_9MICC|nr:hypothetical protein GCM10010977_15690 [Citricoccus zhacaiensis]
MVGVPYVASSSKTAPAWVGETLSQSISTAMRVVALETSVMVSPYPGPAGTRRNLRDGRRRSPPSAQASSRALTCARNVGYGAGNAATGQRPDHRSDIPEEGYR